MFLSALTGDHLNFNERRVTYYNVSYMFATNKEWTEN